MGNQYDYHGGRKPFTVMSVTEPTAHELMSPLKEDASRNMRCGAGVHGLQKRRDHALAARSVGGSAARVWMIAPWELGATAAMRASHLPTWSSPSLCPMS